MSLALVAWVLPAPAEAQVAREGILRATISDDFARGESKTIYRLHAGGKATTVVPTGPVTAETGDRVSVEGALREGRLVGQVSEEQDLTPQLDLDAPREVAVIGFRFPGDAAEPWPLEQTRQQVFTGASSANAFYQEESYGDISFTGKLSPEGDVFGWYTVNGSSGCAEGTWDAEARAAAEADGKSLAGYDHIIYVFPYRSACSWLGRASLGGSTVNINGPLGGSQVIAHELGHNLGLLHAGSWSCAKGGERVSIGGSCTVSEYGDPFDVMGNKGTRHSEGWKLYKLGVLSLSENIDTVSSGTHTLKAARTPSPAPEILRIWRSSEPGAPIGAPPAYYYLEIREQGGIFENFADLSTTGVSIRAVGVGSGTTAETLLIDSTPSTFTFFDAPFQVGHTFADGNVHVTVLAAGAGTATVSIGTGAFVDEEAPSAPANLSASQVDADVKLQWSASEDNLAVTGYAIFRDDTEIGAGSGTSFTDTSATPGLHSYTVKAEDEAGNRSEASPPAAVTVVEPEGEDGGEGPEPPPDEGTPPAPVPPSLPPYIPPPSPPAPETKQKTQVKPVFRLRRRSNGAFAFNVDARRNPRVVRVSVWLNGRLLRLTKGRLLRFAWRPGKRRCLRAYRFSARAYERTPAGRVVARIRLRSVRAAKRTRCAGAAG